MRIFYNDNDVKQWKDLKNWTHTATNFYLNYRINTFTMGRDTLIPKGIEGCYGSNRKNILGTFKVYIFEFIQNIFILYCFRLNWKFTIFLIFSCLLSYKFERHQKLWSNTSFKVLRFYKSCDFMFCEISQYPNIFL